MKQRKFKRNPIKGILFLCLIFISGILSATSTSQQLGKGNAWDGVINPEKIELRWSFNPAENSDLGLNDFLTTARPCVSEDGSTVFLYGDISGSDGKIVALDAFYGTVKWSLDVQSYIGYGSSSSPVFNNGYVYWAGSDDAGNAYVYKINAANGSIEESSGGWITLLPEADGIVFHSIVNASPTIGAKRVFISTYGGWTSVNACHFALNIADGSVIWSNNDGGGGQGAMAYDQSRNRVYQTFYDGTNHILRAYNVADGSVAWTADWVCDNSASQCAITFKFDKLYFQDYNFYGDGKIYVVNPADGEKIWTAPTPVSGDGMPVVDSDGNVYVYGDSGVWGQDPPATGQTRAYDNTGATLWESDFTLGGGWLGFPAWADGCLFVGDQSANNLYILNSNDGTIIKTLSGSGPVAFGARTFFSTGTDGVLYAYSTSNDYANEVVECPNSGTGFADPNNALGRPSVDTLADGSIPPDRRPPPVVNVYPAWGLDQLLTVTSDRHLVIKFDHPIENDPDNRYGLDLIVFGNAFQEIGGGASWTNGDPNLTSTGGGIFAENGLISVSQDGITWHQYATPVFDGFAPTFGRIYDTENPHHPDVSWDWNNWWGVPTDATLPINPAWDATTCAGKTVKESSEMFGRAAGGAGFDIASFGLEWIQYVKFNVGDGGNPEVDAISDARIVADENAPDSISNLALTPAPGTIDLTWTNPATQDFAGVIVLRKEVSAPTGVPTDGIAFFPSYNEIIEDAVVVYNGKDAGFSDIGLSSGGTYYYHIYAYDQSLNYSSVSEGYATTEGYISHSLIVNSGTGSGSYQAGLNVNISANIPAGEHFTTWTGGTPANFANANSADTTYTTAAIDETLTANFATNTYTLTYTVDANGSINGDASQSVDHGLNGTAVTAVPNAGYQFVAWSDSFPEHTRTDTNVTANIAVTAQFSIDGSQHFADNSPADWSISEDEVNNFIGLYANNSNEVTGDAGSFDDPDRITMREVLRVIYLYNGSDSAKYIGDQGAGTVDGYDVDRGGPLKFASAPKVVPVIPAAPSETITVANSADSGAGSFRNAIANAAEGDIITFDKSLKQITLISEILIDKSITIDGNGITIISGEKQTRIFQVYNEYNEITVMISNIGIVDAQNSSDEFGGAIYNNGENLKLDSCLFDGNANSAAHESGVLYGKGGAVYTSGTLTLTNCVFQNNTAAEEDDIYSTNNEVIE